jgi:dipeptidyl aminopeptidase/acylaminoacyl peptidase
MSSSDALPAAVLLDPTVLHAARRGPRPMTPADLWTIPRVGMPVWSPDGAALVTPVTAGEPSRDETRTRLWWVPRDGAQRALTSPEHTSVDPAVSPDGRRLAFVRKTGARAQLHLLDLACGEPRVLTDLPLGCFDPRWLPDGSALLCWAPLLAGHASVAATRAELERREGAPVRVRATEERVYRHWDTWLPDGEVPHLFVVDAASGAARDLIPAGTFWLDAVEPHGRYDIAPDGREAAFEGHILDGPRGGLRAAVFTVPIAGGEVRCLTAGHPSNDLRPRYAPDGRSLVYGMQHEHDFYADRVRLMRYDRARGEHTPWLGDWDRSPEVWEFLPDGALVFVAEDEARRSLFHWDGRGVPRCLLRGGAVGGVVVARDGTLAVTLQDLARPTEVHLVAATGGPARRLTRFTDTACAEFATGEVREAHVLGAGGRRVQLFVVLPPGDTPSPLPLVHVLHGGPHAISGDAFHPRWNAQVLAAGGQAVALLNFHGSTSWGQEFARCIHGRWGDQPATDVMRATDALVAAGWADGARLAVAGGSYGGFLATWMTTRTDRFRCAVNHAGVYDLLAQYASDITQGRERSFGGEPWTDLEALDRWNPARCAATMGTPLLVLHGERDFRVPVAQGLACYGVLKAKGVPARLVVFHDEHHWVLRPGASVRWYAEVIEWLRRWLAPEAPA